MRIGGSRSKCKGDRPWYTCRLAPDRSTAASRARATRQRGRHRGGGDRRAGEGGTVVAPLGADVAGVCARARSQTNKGEAVARAAGVARERVRCCGLPRARAAADRHIPEGASYQKNRNSNNNLYECECRGGHGPSTPQYTWYVYATPGQPRVDRQCQHTHRERRRRHPRTVTPAAENGSAF